MPTETVKERSMVQRKKVKIGIRKGGGSPPGYEWNVWIIDFVFDEAVELLGEAGYAHLAMQVRELARQKSPKRSDTVDVKPIEVFYEVRDRGGIYGNANVRLFFGVDDSRRAIIPLGVIKKQNDGKTPLGDKVRMRRRWRKYLNGDYGFL